MTISLLLAALLAADPGSPATPGATPSAPPPAPCVPAPLEGAGPGAAEAPAGGTFALGVSWARPTGNVSGRYGSVADYWSDFLQLDAEGGVRVTPATTVLLQADLGGADAGGGIENLCRTYGYACRGTTFRVGVAARYAFTPTARSTPWISAGIGREDTTVDVKGPAGTQTFWFGGWEWLKLGAGWDARLSRTFGAGAFASFSVGGYRTLALEGPANLTAAQLGATRAHGWLELGLRGILFP